MAKQWGLRLVSILVLHKVRQRYPFRFFDRGPKLRSDHHCCAWCLFSLNDVRNCCRLVSYVDLNRRYGRSKPYILVHRLGKLLE